MTKAQQLKKQRENYKNNNNKKDNTVIETKTSGLSWETLIDDKVINNSLKEYDRNIENVEEIFRDKTQLQGYDIGFLMFATMLQAIRIYFLNPIISKKVNELTEIEKANILGGREEKIHNVQDNLFKAEDARKRIEDNNFKQKEYYASLDEILAIRGVPYDTTNYANDELRKQKLFKGANHRFATLGHDPLLGLIFGTSNILTNTITLNNQLLFNTYHVKYTNLKQPKIHGNADSLTMFYSVYSRFQEKDYLSISAAIIKQLLHLATDMYTPCGIQLPGASLCLDRASVEKLTNSISTGDVLKFSANSGISAAISVFINYLISAIHTSYLLFESNDSNDIELNKVRTKKILMYSNMIASTSNVIYAGFTKNINNIDFGGAMVTCYQLFNVSKFIDDIKYEFINTKLNEIYEEKNHKIAKYYIDSVKNMNK